MKFQLLLFLGIGAFILFISSKSSAMENIDYNWLNDVYSMSKKFNVDHNIIFAIIKQESDGNVSAVRQGIQPSIGLMQVTIPAARQVGFHGNISQLYVPKVNIYYGVKYLRYLLNMFGGNYRDAIASYNAGPGSFIKGRYSVHYVDNVYKNYYNLNNGDNIFK